VHSIGVTVEDNSFSPCTVTIHWDKWIG